MEVVPMGFSVSGAAAIIFISIFLAFGVWFTAASNSFDMVTDAQDDRADRSLTAENTNLSEVEAVYDTDTERLTINVTNTGTTELSLSETDLLIDGEYITDWQADASVAGDSETDLWLSNEKLTITLERDSAPSTVKLATVTGVHAQAAVEVISSEEDEESSETDSIESALFTTGTDPLTRGAVHGI